MSSEDIAFRAINNGLLGLAAGFLGGNGVQYDTHMTTYVTNIFFDGKVIGGVMQKTVWTAVGKYGPPIIGKELLKGFVKGAIPSSEYAIYEILHYYFKRKLESGECTE